MQITHLESLLTRMARALDVIGRPVRLMEVCGTHTHVIGRNGLRALLPRGLELISGPGCPVCVTSQRDIERMLLLAQRFGVVLCTFGDMVRVPGLTSSLERARAAGADVRVVYSATNALHIAKSALGCEVVFIAVGFETTAPGVASIVLQAADAQIDNFSLVVSHKRIVPAMAAVLDGGSRIDGFITPGHVSVIIGAKAYEGLARQYGTPCVATGFEPNDILEAIAMLLECLAEGRAASLLQYTRAVKPHGNPRAQAVLAKAFDVTDAEWRGLGTIPESGFALKPQFHRWDAIERFALPELESVQLPGCRCGEVLRGLIHPPECPFFGRECTPRNPVGPCMVSSEGSCAARYKYG